MRGIPFRTTPSPVSLIWKRRVSSAVTGFCRQKKIMIFPWISETTENSLYLKKLQTDSLDETILGRQKKSLPVFYALYSSNPGAVSKLTKRIFFQMKDFEAFHCSDPQEPRYRQHDHPVSPGICKTQDSVTETCILRRSFSGDSWL